MGKPAVPVALRCAEDIAQRPLAEVLESAIALGGDTDTIASITGQLAGAVTGFAGVSQYVSGMAGTYPEASEVVSKFADFGCSPGN